MGVSNVKRLLVAMLACAWVLPGPASAADTSSPPLSPAASASRAAGPTTRLEDYRLLALSPSEGVAVLRAPDRQLVTLKIGATLPAARARLAQVLGDRLRFETADETGARQTAWMIRSGGPDQPPEVQRVSSVGPPRLTANGIGQAAIAPLGGASAPK
jgi:hypothetical protein